MPNFRGVLSSLTHSHKPLAVLVFFVLFLSTPSLVSAATYTVTKTADTADGVCDADCSLREAIVAANAAGGADTINFNIPTSDSGYRDYDDPNTASSGDSADGDDYWTIRPTSAFPDLASGGLTVDGSTQTTNQGDKNTFGPEVEIDAINAGNLANSGCSSFGKGLFQMSNLSSATYSFKSLVINDVQKGSGISVASGGSSLVFSLTQSYIGVDVKGATAKPNTLGGGSVNFYGAGVLFCQSQNGTVTIGGDSTSDRNILSGNQGWGINYGTGGTSSGFTETSFVVKNNYVGTDRTGSSAIGNGAGGVNLAGLDTATVDSNVTSGNTGGPGIGLFDSKNITVSNNTIGLSADETTAMRNNRGIDWRNNSSTISSTGILIDNNVIGDGATGDGIVTIMHSSTTSSGTISNNFIGTNRAKTAYFPSARWGMCLGNCSFSSAVSVATSFIITVNDNVIANAGQSGSSGDGIAIASSNITATLQGNQIYNSKQNGIYVQNVHSTANTSVKITSSLIYGNGETPIDLIGGTEDGHGVTTNDSGDTDTGPNSLMNWPAINQVSYQGNNQYRVEGTLDGLASEAPFTIEVFLSDSHTSGHGGGTSYLGSTSTSSSTWSATVTVTGDDGSQCRTFTTTATNVNNATSEFGNNLTRGNCPTTAGPPAVPEYLGGAPLPTTIVEKNNIISLAPFGAFKWDAYLSVIETPKTGTFRLPGTSFWQATPIYEVWWRSFFNSAKILSSEVQKPFTLVFKYNPDSFEKTLSEKALRLAYSTDKKKWKILPSLLSTKNNTLATITKTGGYYMLVSGYFASEAQALGFETQTDSSQKQATPTPGPTPSSSPSPISSEKEKVSGSKVESRNLILFASIPVVFLLLFLFKKRRKRTRIS